MFLEQNFRLKLADRFQKRWDRSFSASGWTGHGVTYCGDREKADQKRLLEYNWDRISEISDFEDYFFVRARLPVSVKWELDKRMIFASLTHCNFSALAVDIILEGMTRNLNSDLNGLEVDGYFKLMDVEDASLMLMWLSASKDYFQNAADEAGKVFDVSNHNVRIGTLAALYSLRVSQNW